MEMYAAGNEKLAQSSPNNHTKAPDCTQYDVIFSLFEHYSWRASCAGDVLDRKLMVSRTHRVRKVELVTNTFVYAFCRPETKLVMIVAGILLLFCSFISMEAYLSYPFPIAQLSSVKIDETGLSTVNISLLRLNSAELILNAGCQDAPDNESSSDFERPVTVLGFRINLNTSGCERSESFFTIKASKDGGKTFEVIGASSFRWTLTGLRFVDRGINGCLSLALDYQLPWPQHFSDESVLFLLLSGCAVFGAGACTIFRLQKMAKTALIFVCLGMAFIQFVSFAGFLSLHMPMEAFYPGCCCPGYALLALALAYRDRWLCESMLASGLFFLAARAVNDCVVFEDCAYLLAYPPVIQAALAALGAYFTWLRRRVVSKILLCVAVDWAEFCRVWDELAAGKENRQPLARLQELAGCVGDTARPRQFNRVRSSDRARKPSSERVTDESPVWRMSSSFKAALRTETEEATFEVPATLPATHGDPVRSVCQLYSQALCVAPLLFSACSDWAARSGGRLDRYQVDYTPSRLFPETLQRWMLAGVIKEPGRAIAKLLACYDGDVSCLLDVCRCRIVFDSVAGMARCLEVVAGPGPARVVRVKNGLAAGHDAAASGGFRAVVLSARLVSHLFPVCSPT